MGGKKAKKQKRELSQAEIWDDSALVQSWDDALAEYKVNKSVSSTRTKLTVAQKYHSIHAKGQTMNDLPENLDGSSVQSEVADKTVRMDPISAPEDLEMLEDGELKDEDDEKIGEDIQDEAPPKAGRKRTDDATSRDQQSFLFGVPIAVSNGVQNEALKNLMMSWYYAGYYTGLYEGQVSQEGRPKG